jgi:formylglycine-generating enzyme required for sulfatase activity
MRRAWVIIACLLLGTLYFSPGIEAKGDTENLKARSAELEMWQRARSLGTLDAYREYLGKYPNGRYSALAKLAVAKLGPLVFRDCSGCPEMVRIPGGSFLMGLPHNEVEERMVEVQGPYATVDEERPQHTVQVPSFSIGKYEVTFNEWDACVAGGGCKKHPSDKGWGHGRQPVINVNWDDTQQYVSWLSKKTGHRYRLPSEAEWEYAARAGTTTAYYWGEYAGDDNANCGECTSQWTDRAAPVGSFPPNPWGLHDMGGNVFQWTEDCWNNSYSHAPSNGSAWTTGDCARHVLRGSSYRVVSSVMRVASRSRNLDDNTDNTDNDTGFRVARAE